MIRSAGDPGLWAAEVAARLRLLQSGFADGDPEARRHMVEEELDRALKQVALGKRAEYIDALEAEFPTLEASGQNASAPAQAAAPCLPDEPMALAARLVETLPLAGQERDAVMNCLEQAGLVRYTGAVAGAEPPEELQEWMDKLLGGKHLDAVRSYRLLNVLVELASNMDQLVWQVWKKVAPKTLIRQETSRVNDLRKMLGPYLSGDPEISTDQIKQNVARTRQLNSGLLASICAVGGAYSFELLNRMSPDSIRQLAQAERGPFESAEKKCWRKHNDVFNEFSQVSIEKEYLDAVKKYTEKLVLGAQAVRNL